MRKKPRCLKGEKVCVMLGQAGGKKVVLNEIGCKSNVLKSYETLPMVKLADRDGGKQNRCFAAEIAYLAV